jgi:predicted  nucleic acid-binding Zn-ribbon protein
MVDHIARLVAADHEAMEALRERARKLRAQLGQELDDVAREHSKTLGWAGLVAERSDSVRSRRHSGFDPIPVMEAMTWEQAALDQEEDSARDRAQALETEMRRLQGEIARENDRLEHEMLVGTAQLDGRVAALRSVALEAWVAMQDVTRRMGMPEDALLPGTAR